LGKIKITFLALALRLLNKYAVYLIAKSPTYSPVNNLSSLPIFVLHMIFFIFLIVLLSSGILKRSDIDIDMKRERKLYRFSFDQLKFLFQSIFLRKENLYKVNNELSLSIGKRKFAILPK
jgi:hypothetical protein